MLLYWQQIHARRADCAQGHPRRTRGKSDSEAGKGGELMKEWKAPTVEEIDVEMTAGGTIFYFHEGEYLDESTHGNSL